MKTNFIEELKWRGMLHDVMPGTEELLNKGVVTGYIGFDPTADSLGVGNMVQIMTLLHFQQAGHKPIALVGGATGMVGDPSGKSLERNLLSEETLNHNLNCQQKQLEKLINNATFINDNTFIYIFIGRINKDKGINAAQIVNNYDWFKQFSFLEFIRDVGKYLTVNYMLAKDSVKNRLENGMSFTEFSYQLVQGYDFYYLWKNKGVMLQMGGSDQWGNIVTGTELIRKKEGGEAFALTTPLIKKADGTKFGKSESGNVWLDRNKTSPYTRVLQKALAKDITIRVHSESDYNAAIEASEILFGKGTAESLQKLSEDDFLSVFEGVEQYKLLIEILNDGIALVDLLTDKTTIFPSKGEARKMIQGGGVSINKQKIEDVNFQLTTSHLLNNKYMLVQKGKKNYSLVVF